MSAGRGKPRAAVVVGLAYPPDSVYLPQVSRASPRAMFVDLVIAGIFALSILPLTTGYCAYSYGRSFWLWFALGVFLPILSYFVLFALILRQQLDHGQRLLAEAKTILAEAEEAARAEKW